MPALTRNFIAHLHGFDAFGTPTQVLVDNGIPYWVNEFWTAAQRKAHALHEVSYRACFKPQLPAFFIAQLTTPGEAVYDPFMGRGTTPLEAALLGRRPMGNDVNPLSTLLVRPRLTPPDITAIEQRLRGIAWDTGKITRKDLLAFYHPDTLRQIEALRTFLFTHAPIGNAQPDPVDDWIRMAALNRLAGHSPGFFSVYTLPPNQAVSIDSQRRINASRNQTPPERDVAALILRKSRALLKHGTPPAHDAALFCTGPAHATPAIADASVALTVTSPPFLDIVHYADDNWLRGWFAGIDTATVPIAMHRTEAAWTQMVRDVLTELARITRPGGHVAFEVGEVRQGRIRLERNVWQAAEGLPFERLGVMVNQQDFTKTANCWGVANNTRGTNSNRIVLLRRQ